ncbi:MAG: hypothetical protein GF404_11940 [candidate division Zixibacteria bacterium]|nr:hypothetical protein [candidate division Zixibacteria bacterium]
MPGFSFYYSPHGIDPQMEKTLDSALQSVRFLAEYKTSSLFSDDKLRLMYCAYDGYPLFTFEADGLKIFLEGKIYDRDECRLGRFVQDIATCGLKGGLPDSEFSSYLDSKLLLCDGDFNLVAIDPANSHFLIINDSFGKLLLYQYRDDDSLVVSRDIRFIQKTKSIRDLDSYALAEFLMFKFTLGGKTHLSGVQHLPHGVYCRNRAGRVPEFRRYTSWDLSESDFGRSIDRNVEDLVELFLEASENRERHKNRHISLLGMSGGLDSRCVMGALEKLNVDYKAVSTINHSRENLHDVETAARVAALYQREFISWVLNPPALEDYRMLVESRSGLNDCGMAVALQLYREMLSHSGWGANFYTGDGGAFIKTPYRISHRIRNENDLYKYITRSSYFNPEEIEALLNISPDQLKSHILEILGSYPGDTWNDKNYHYEIFDRRISFLFEGEERTRLFFWTVAPFEAQPFIAKALRLPDRFKRNFAFSIKFLERLDKRLLDIPYADLNANVNSLKAVFKINAKAWLQNHPALLRIAKTILHPAHYKTGFRPGFHNDVLEIARSSPVLRECLDCDHLVEMIQGNLDSGRYTALLTILLYSRSLES